MIQPKLAIGIPTRNRADKLARLVQRCLTQKAADFEIIVSDDASDDDTLARLEALADPRLIVLRQHENIGMVPNWNACLAACRSEFFVLLSDDDMIFLDYASSINKVLEVLPETDVLFARSWLVNELTGETDRNPSPLQQASYIDFTREFLPRWMDSSFTIPLLSMVFRTSVLRRYGGFTMDFPYAADIATGFPIAIRERCAFYPDVKAECIVHEGGATNSFRLEILIDDVLKLSNLLVAEVRAVRVGEPELVQHIETGAKRYRRDMFGVLMMLAARRGVSKWKLLKVWSAYFNKLPLFGFGPLSAGAVFVPRPLIQLVGWPYRKFVAWYRTKKAGRATIKYSDSK